MSVIRARWALGFIVLWMGLAAWALVAVPDLSRRVTDLTATLSADQVASLEQKLAALEAQKGSQLAVLIVPTTQPEDIAQFGLRVADQWKIGREKADDGVILVVAKDDRKLRLEVGYGLEGAIPDAIAKRVIAETITPYFKAGDFYGGIDAGVQQVTQLIQGESLPPPSPPSAAGGTGENLIVLIVLGFFLGSFFSALLGRGLASSLAGAGTGTLAWLTAGGLGASLFVGGLVFFAVLLLGGIRGGGG
ncbi:MAG: TPM domain-containing protein, partial [Thiobacillus sp.]